MLILSAGGMDVSELKAIWGGLLQRKYVALSK